MPAINRLVSQGAFAQCTMSVLVRVFRIDSWFGVAEQRSLGQQTANVVRAGKDKDIIQSIATIKEYECMKSYAHIAKKRSRLTKLAMLTF